MATYNAAATIEACLRSALAQSLAAIEVIVVDDASHDDTVAIVQRIAASDPRLQLVQMARNGGPAAARNRALDLARGEWFAVLDSDDLIAPDRIARMVDLAQRESADTVADDLVAFQDGDPASARFFLPPDTAPRWLDLPHYLDQTQMFARGGANYGYLKPMFRRAALQRAGLRYDETLRIAEDDDLIVRMLLAGLRYRLSESAGYAYRQHPASTSHRLAPERAAAMVRASAALLAAAGRAHPAHRALRARHAAFVRAESFARLVDALKQRRAGTALKLALANPAALPLLRMPLGAALARLGGRDPGARHGAIDPAAQQVLAAIRAGEAQ